MNEPPVTPDLAKRVHDLVREYAIIKADLKMAEGQKWDDIRARNQAMKGGEWQIPDEYRDARRKVCTDAFLRLRSCKSRQDFVTYFTGTICSVPQFLPEDEYEKLGQVLLHGENWSDVKALAMLALSGLSRV